MLKKICIFGIIIIFLIGMIFKFFKNQKVNFKLNFYSENHITKIGEATMYKYHKYNYCFSENEIMIISKQFKYFDIFNNDNLELLRCGDVEITIAPNDYDTFGYIKIYSSSSFDKIKELFELNYSNEQNIQIYDTWILIKLAECEIRFYKNDNSDDFRVVYVVELPYKYNINKIDEYSEMKYFFLKINNELNYR